MDANPSGHNPSELGVVARELYTYTGVYLHPLMAAG